MSTPGTAKSEEDFVRREGSLKRDVPFDMLLGSALDTVYIPKAFMGVVEDDTADSSDRKSDSSYEDNLKKPSHTLNTRIQPRGHHKKLVICFDDTKRGFTGDESDSNVAKIHRMFERQENDQVCFYRSWTSDTTLEELTMAGYRFLMEHYQRTDVISIFGYSKGGFAAQYLSNLVEYVGILVNGHDHMISEVWRIFHDHMSSRSETDKQQQEKRKKLGYMKAFRDAFIRPTGGTHFIGLFDASKYL